MKQFSLTELAQLTETKLVGDGTHVVTSINTLESATTTDASFLANPKYKEAMKESHAGVICIDPDSELVPGKNYLVSSNPSKTFQAIAKCLLDLDAFSSGFSGVHPSSTVHETASIGEGCTIGPNVVIDKGVKIGNKTHIIASSFVGANSTIGDECVIHAGATIRELCHLHNRVIIQPGAVIGSCGFGYLPDNQGNLTKLDQIGSVVIEDDVEVGANTTIDRARFKETRIGKGTKIDNLVQIAHNVELGENNIVLAQAGIAGSTKCNKRVFIGPQAGVIGHVELADDVKIATRGGVSKSMSKAGVYGGSPVTLLTEHNKRQVKLRKIDTYSKRIKELEEDLKYLQEKLSYFIRLK